MYAVKIISVFYCCVFYAATSQTLISTWHCVQGHISVLLKFEHLKMYMRNVGLPRPTPYRFLNTPLVVLIVTRVNMYSMTEQPV